MPYYYYIRKLFLSLKEKNCNMPIPKSWSEEIVLEWLLLEGYLAETNVPSGYFRSILPKTREKGYELLRAELDKLII